MNLAGDREVKQFLVISRANPELNSQFKENNRTYQVRLQVAKYTKFSEKLLADPPIVYAGLDKQNNHSVLIFANMIPSKESQKQEFEQCVLLLVQILDQKLESKNPYIIVFFNTSLMTASKLNDFRTVMTQLPLKYFEFLDRIYVLHSNFIVRSGVIFSGSEILAYLKKRIIFVDKFDHFIINLSMFQLSKMKVFKYEMLKYVKDYVKQQDTSYKDIQFIRKHSILKQSIEGSTDKTVEDIDDQEMNNFNKESKILGLPLEKYEKNYQEIPKILDVLISYFVQNEQYMLEEGIFRKQGAVLEEKILEAALANQKYEFIVKIEDPHVICGIIKQFFLQLPEPVIPFNVYDMILQHSNGKANPENNLNYAGIVMGALPKQNRQIVAFICQFLSKVIQYEDQNKMTAYNMAVVFGPSFFRAKRQSMNDFVYIGFFITLLQTIIENTTKLFPDFNYKNCLLESSQSRRLSMKPDVNEDVAVMEDLYELIGSILIQPFNTQMCADEEKIDEMYQTAMKQINKETKEEQEQQKLDLSNKQTSSQQSALIQPTVQQPPPPHQLPSTQQVPPPQQILPSQKPPPIPQRPIQQPSQGQQSVAAQLGSSQLPQTQQPSKLQIYSQQPPNQQLPRKSIQPSQQDLLAEIQQFKLKPKPQISQPQQKSPQIFQSKPLQPKSDQKSQQEPQNNQQFKQLKPPLKQQQQKKDQSVSPHSSNKSNPNFTDSDSEQD